MSRSVRISLKAARRILEEFDGGGIHGPILRAALVELRAAMAPRRSVSLSRKRRVAKRKTKAEETAEIRALVWKRANGECEACGCAVDAGQVTLGPVAFRRGELDHFFGRGKVRQAVSNCWLICDLCHRQKTANHPSAAEWLGRFISHCQKYGFDAEAGRARHQMRFVATRASLPAAPGVAR